MSIMSNEALNNSSSWKQQLAELEQLPGEPFDKEAPWERLHGRLKPESGKKRIFWYWAAATLLVCMIAVPAIFTHKKQAGKIRKQTVATAPVPPRQPSATAIAGNPETARHVRPGSRHAGSQLPIIKQRSHPGSARALSNITLGETAQIPPATRTLLPVEKPVADFSTALMASPKKKLKVVYINELGDSQSEDPMVQSNTSPHFFKMQLGDQEVFVSPTRVSREAGFTIIHSK